MIYTSVSAVFHASPQHVFQVATSLGTLSEWVQWLRNIRVDSKSPVRVGTEFLADQGFAKSARERDNRFRVTEWTPGRAFGFETVDTMEFEGQLLIRECEDGSMVTWTFSSKATAWVDKILSALMSPSVKKGAARQAEGELEHLGQLVARSELS
jgi:hypothetical protein